MGFRAVDTAMGQKDSKPTMPAGIKCQSWTVGHLGATTKLKSSLVLTLGTICSMRSRAASALGLVLFLSFFNRRSPLSPGLPQILCSIDKTHVQFSLSSESLSEPVLGVVGEKAAFRKSLPLFEKIFLDR